MQIAMLEDVLSVTSGLCLLLQSDRKDFSSIQRAVKQTIDSLSSMRDDESHVLLSAFAKSTDIIEKIQAYKHEKMVSKHTRTKSKIDIQLSVSSFHRTVSRPFLTALIKEIAAAFDITDLPIVEAILCSAHINFSLVEHNL